MPRSERQKPLAIFDIDGTIFRSSLLIELTEALVHFGIFPESARKQIQVKELLWNDRKGSYGDYILEVVRVYSKALTGIPRTVIAKISKQVIAEQKDRVYVYTRKLLHALRRSHRLVAISGSPSEIVSEFKNAWHFDDAFGLVYRVSRGRFTGEVEESPVKNKLAFLLRYCKRNGFSLKGSVGVGDTESDAEFLQAVQYPIAFNPNRRLLNVAKARQWKVIVERKDVIYHI